MRHNFKISMLFSALLIIFLSACQSDELNENKQSDEINKVKASELLMLLKNPHIRKSIFKNNEKSIDSSINIDPYFEMLDFADFDNYTLFFSNYTTETPYYKSLVVTIDKNNVENAFYVQYTPTEPGYDGSQPFNIKKFIGQVGISDLEGNPRASWQLNHGVVTEVFDEEDCETTINISVVPCSHDGGHTPGQECKQGYVNDSYYLVSVTVKCDHDYIFAGGGSYNGGGSSTGGGGAGSAPSSSEVFYGKLLPAQQEFLDANPKIKSNVSTFLGKFSYANQTASDYAKMMIDKMMETGLVFDLYRSFRSPVNIDVTNIDNSPEGIKFKKVYDRLTDSPKFKQLFVNLFGDGTNINAIFKIADLPPGTDGETIWVQTPKGILTNQITLDKDLLLESSDIRIARVIIHECIHAFLNIKAKQPNIGMSVSDINNMDFTDIINTLYNGLQGNPAQHNFFVDHMIPVMAEILSQSKQTLLTPEQIDKVDNPQSSINTIFAPTNSTPPTNSGIPTPWIWNDFFKYFSLEGLHNANSFYTVYPVDSVEYYYFNRYMTVATVTFQP